MGDVPRDQTFHKSCIVPNQGLYFCYYIVLKTHSSGDVKGGNLDACRMVII